MEEKMQLKCLNSSNKRYAYRLEKETGGGKPGKTTSYKRIQNQ